jgi:hypothetical protein
MYEVEMRFTTRWQLGKYYFSKKSEVQEFLEGLTIPELDAVLSIMKFNKKSIRNAFYDFFVE